MAVFMGNGFEVFLFMESGIVEDDGRIWPQRFTQHVACPIVDEMGVGGAFEQHGGKKVLATPRCDQTGSRAAITGMIAIDFLPAQTPAVTAAHIGFEAGFIDVNKVG